MGSAALQLFVTGRYSGNSKLYYLLTLFYSARLLLHGKERLPIQSSLNAATFEIRQSKAIESEIAASMLKVAQALGVMGDCASQEASPFCSHAMYRAGLFYAREQRDLGEPLGSKAFEDIKLGLAVIGNRWKAAGKLIEWPPLDLRD